MTVRVDLSEWKELGSDTPCLRGLVLHGPAREVASRLAAGDRLIVREHREGLSVQATSWVGRVTVGEVEVTVHPKIAPDALLTLVRYAYGLRDLSLFHPSRYTSGDRLFVDLLVNQLVDEVEELLARGLHRGYERRTELLRSPRGRLDFARMVRSPGQTTAGLPCSHHPRLADNPLNRALLTGLQFGADLASDPSLRISARRLAARMTDDVTAVAPSRLDLEAVQRQVTRLTSEYTPALTLIGLLLDGAGLSLRREEDRVPVRGFLFDMNRFFQRLLSRFLREFLPSSYQLADEHRLTEVMEYAEGFNPRRRRRPTPRPDFALLGGGHLLQFFDAKYRDLWERNLPADMLYQLAIYAMAGGASRTSVILYPALDGATADQRIDVRNPLGGLPQGSVVLRGVDLMRVRRLVEEDDVRASRALVDELLNLDAEPSGAIAPRQPRGVPTLA